MAKSRILTEIRGRADRFRTICGVELSGLSVLIQMLPVLVEIGQSGRPALGIVIDFPSGISGKEREIDIVYKVDIASVLRYKLNK